MANIKRIYTVYLYNRVALTTMYSLIWSQWWARPKEKTRGTYQIGLAYLRSVYTDLLISQGLSDSRLKGLRVVTSRLQRALVLFWA